MVNAVCAYIGITVVYRADATRVYAALGFFVGEGTDLLRHRRGGGLDTVDRARPRASRRDGGSRCGT